MNSALTINSNTNSPIDEFGIDEFGRDLASPAQRLAALGDKVFTENAELNALVTGEIRRRVTTGEMPLGEMDIRELLYIHRWTRANASEFLRMGEYASFTEEKRSNSNGKPIPGGNPYELSEVASETGHGD